MKNWEDLNKRLIVLTESINELLQRHDALLSFRDAREWDHDAQALIGLLVNSKDDYIALRGEQEKLLTQLTQERNNKPFFKRVLSSQSAENQVKESIKALDSTIEEIGDTSDGIYEKMDKTPANKSEQKEIAGELKELKKELVLQKREANEQLRQTRAAARQKNASWTGVRGGVLGSVARYQRASIRMEKEESLVPIEGLRKFIERKLIAVERDINWVMHFKADDQEKSQDGEQVRRCNYCGRRVEATASVCSSCGAVV